MAKDKNRQLFSAKQLMIMSGIVLVALFSIYCVALYFSSKSTTAGWAGLQLPDLIVIIVNYMALWVVSYGGLVLIPLGVGLLIYSRQKPTVRGFSLVLLAIGVALFLLSLL